MYLYFFFFSCLSLLYYRAAQLVHVMQDRLKEVVEDADWEKALTNVAVAITKDKGKAAELAKKRGQTSEKAQILAE